MNDCELLSKLSEKGFAIFEDQRLNYNLNIIGVRNPQSRVNYFDDTLYVIWKYNDTWYSESWPITTYPGLPSLLKPVNPYGTAILVAGQYRGAMRIGLHKGKYRALVQAKAVKVYRDADLDGEFDLNDVTIEEGMFGINIHKAGVLTQLIGPNSAGCQVFQKSDDFYDFMFICEKAAKNWGNSFTYTLLEGNNNG